jgi:hypothetical protein
MSADLRLKRKGQLQTMKENHRKIHAEAGNAITILQMKADPYEPDRSILDIISIKQAAEDLINAVRALRDLNTEIANLNNELYG